MSTSIAKATSTNILGPLTQTWTQPSGCTVVVGGGPCPTCTTAWVDQQCIEPTGAAGDTSCFPPTTAGASPKATDSAVRSWGVYSPGLVCPSGYSSACSSHGPENTGDYDFHFPPGPSESAIGCCPS